MSPWRKFAAFLLTVSLCLASSAAASEAPPLLPTAEYASDGVRYGLEQNGSAVLPCVHEDIRRIGSTYALCAAGRWGLFSADGAWRTDFLYEDVLPCADGVLCIESAEENHAVLLTPTGKTLLDTRKMPVFEALEPYAVYCLAAYREGFAAVYTPAGGSVFVNAAGDMLPLPFTYTEGFHEGTACVLTDGRWGYLAPDGKWLLAPVYLQAQSFHGGSALVRDETGPAVIDREGNILWRPTGDYAWQVCYGSQSFYGVHARGENRYYTAEGTLLAHEGVPLEMEEFFYAKTAGGIFLLTPGGNEVFLPGAERLLWGGSEELFAVETAAGHAVMNSRGKAVLYTGEEVPSFLQDIVTGEWFIYVPVGEHFTVYTSAGRHLAESAFLTEPVGGWFAHAEGWQRVSR